MLHEGTAIGIDPDYNPPFLFTTRVISVLRHFYEQRRINFHGGLESTPLSASSPPPSLRAPFSPPVAFSDIYSLSPSFSRFRDPSDTFTTEPFAFNVIFTASAYIPFVKRVATGDKLSRENAALLLHPFPSVLPSIPTRNYPCINKDSFLCLSP